MRHLATDSRKALNELIQRIVVFQVVKQRLYWNPCAAENRGAPEDFRIDCYQRLISHGIILSQTLHRVNSGALVGPAIFLINLFEQLPQILKHGVFFVRARAIGDKELLAQVQCLSLHYSGTKPIPYRSQELISVPLIFCRVPCVINRSHIELIERYFRVPIELRDRIRDQPVLREEDQIVGRTCNNLASRLSPHAGAG